MALQGGRPPPARSGVGRFTTSSSKGHAFCRMLSRKKPCLRPIRRSSRTSTWISRTHTCASGWRRTVRSHTRTGSCCMSCAILCASPASVLCVLAMAKECGMVALWRTPGKRGEKSGSLGCRLPVRRRCACLGQHGCSESHSYATPCTLNADRLPLPHQQTAAVSPAQPPPPPRVRAVVEGPRLHPQHPRLVALAAPAPQPDAQQGHPPHRRRRPRAQACHRPASRECPWQQRAWDARTASKTAPARCQRSPHRARDP